LVICLTFSFVFSQCIQPSFEKIKEHPGTLKEIFRLTLAACVFLIVSFLYELKIYDQHKRSVMFKTNLYKVGTAVISLYFIGILFSSWMISLIEFAQSSKRDLIEFNTKKSKMLEEYEETKNQIIYKRKERTLTKPMLHVVKKRIQAFNPVHYEMSEYLDHQLNKFDLFILQDCEHFLEEDDNQYMDLCRSMQSFSTLMFFITVHIPLSRVHTVFAFITAFIPIMLNIQTKYWFYIKLNKVVCFVFKKDQEARNFMKLPKGMQQYKAQDMESEDVGSFI